MSEGAFYVSRDTNDPRDIHFKVASDATVIPADQHALRDRVDQTLVVLRSIYPASDPAFEGYFRQLLSLAQAGLVGKNAQPDLAERSLENLRNEVTQREAGRIKNTYMRTLGFRALALGAPALALAYALHWSVTGTPAEAMFLTVWGGCMGGCWLSFGARKQTIGFDDLQVLERDRLEPLLRLSFAGLLAETLALLIAIGAIDVMIGNVTASAMTTSYKVALVVGILSGLSEQALPARLLQRAGDINP